MRIQTGFVFFHFVFNIPSLLICLLCVCCGAEVSENSLWHLVLPFYHVGSRCQIQILQFGGKHAYPLSLITDRILTPQPLFSQESHCAVQADLELTEIYLPLSPQF